MGITLWGQHQGHSKLDVPSQSRQHASRGRLNAVSSLLFWPRSVPIFLPKAHRLYSPPQRGREQGAGTCLQQSCLLKNGDLCSTPRPRSPSALHSCCQSQKEEPPKNNWQLGLRGSAGCIAAWRKSEVGLGGSGSSAVVRLPRRPSSRIFLSVSPGSLCLLSPPVSY